MKRLITIVLALYSFYLIKMNLPRLPQRIPTHFNVAGEADGWGSADSLWFLLVVQVLICGLLLAVPFLSRRFPDSVHLGFRTLSDFTPAQRERIMPLLSDMMGSMSVFFSLLFCDLLREIIHAASSYNPHLSPWWLGVFFIGTGMIIMYYLRRIYAVAST